MKKRLFAILTAVCCAGAMTLSAAGESWYYGSSSGYDDPLAGKDDAFMIDVDTSYHCILIETDGTVPTAELIGELSREYEIHPADEWYEETTSLNSWGDFTREYEIPENAYIIALDSLGSVSQLTNDINNTIGRSIVVENDWVKTAYGVAYTKYFAATFMGFSLHCKDNTMVLDAEIIPELSNYTFSASEGVCECYLPSYEEGGAYPCGTVAYSEYESHREVYEAISEKYSDYIESVSLIVNTREGGTADLLVYEDLVPIWQTAGDHNADGEVNSNDAADLLVQAAQDGVAEASAAAVSPDSDVNLDGVADSTDAAYILQYAALKGSGADADWVEILK